MRAARAGRRRRRPRAAGGHRPDRRRPGHRRDGLPALRGLAGRGARLRPRGPCRAALPAVRAVPAGAHSPRGRRPSHSHGHRDLSGQHGAHRPARVARAPRRRRHCRCGHGMDRRAGARPVDQPGQPGRGVRGRVPAAGRERRVAGRVGRRPPGVGPRRAPGRRRPVRRPVLSDSPGGPVRRRPPRAGCARPGPPWCRQYASASAVDRRPGGGVRGADRGVHRALRRLPAPAHRLVAAQRQDAGRLDRGLARGRPRRPPDPRQRALRVGRDGVGLRCRPHVAPAARPRRPVRVPGHPRDQRAVAGRGRRRPRDGPRVVVAAATAACVDAGGLRRLAAPTDPDHARRPRGGGAARGHGTRVLRAGPLPHADGRARRPCRRARAWWRCLHDGVDRRPPPRWRCWCCRLCRGSVGLAGGGIRATTATSEPQASGSPPTATRTTG